ncbi:MAG: fasciclin domain-containing protein [Synechococcaceae bacterium WB8_1B_136]|nr:fasciclin domain-containing protein [Synechococcaceae bacterium WB8_1B_136]
MATILDTAAGAGCFNTLLAAVDAAGLRTALEGEGPFTVLAPVDEAFAALPPGTVQTLVDNPPQLARILKFHVIAGALSREVLTARPQWDSLEGAPIPIRRSEPFEVKNATVVQADIHCDNGVVHVINRVILPG